MATIIYNTDYRARSEDVSTIAAACIALVLGWCVYKGVVWWLGCPIAEAVRRLSALRGEDPDAAPGILGGARKYNRRERIANRVADAAREHFGACMEHNRANVLVVQKWVRDHLRDEYKKVTNRDKITISSLAVTLFFMPTPHDEYVAAIRNSAPYRAAVGAGSYTH